MIHCFCRSRYILHWPGPEDDAVVGGEAEGAVGVGDHVGAVAGEDVVAGVLGRRGPNFLLKEVKACKEQRKH